MVSVGLFRLSPSIHSWKHTIYMLLVAAAPIPQQYSYLYLVCLLYVYISYFVHIGMNENSYSRNGQKWQLFFINNKFYKSLKFWMSLNLTWLVGLHSDSLSLYISDSKIFVTLLASISQFVHLTISIYNAGIARSINISLDILLIMFSLVTEWKRIWVNGLVVDCLKWRTWF